MSSNETVRTCEDLLASLSAAETHLRVLCALQLDFADVLDIYRGTARQSRELLGALGLDHARVAALSDIGGRDNTDELLDLAVLGALGVGDETDERTLPRVDDAPAQVARNAPSARFDEGAVVPYDDGPEGTAADDSPPLLTDEESVEISEAADLIELEEVEVASSMEDADIGDVLVMEDDDFDDFEDTGHDMKATDVMSLEDAKRLVQLAADAEDSTEQTEPHGLLSHEIDDNEQTVVASVSAGLLLDDDPSEITSPPTLPRIKAAPPAKTATPTPAPKVKKPKVKAAPPKKKAAKETATNFYAASAAIPTIRDESTQKPRAAAIRLGSDGQSAEVLGDEDEDEPIAIAGVEDEDDLDMDSEGGLQLELEDEWEDDWEEEEEEEEEELMELEIDDLELVDEQPPELATLSEPEKNELIARAQKAAHQGNYEAGVNYYSDVLDADPDHAGAYLGRGRLYLDRLDYSRAMSDFTVAEDIAPEDPEIQVAFGDLYFARKDYRKAIDHYNAALAINDEHAMALCRRGISHHSRRNYKDALADLERAIKLDPDIPNIKHWYGQAKKKAKK